MFRNLYAQIIERLKRGRGSYVRTAGFLLLFSISIAYLMLPRARLYHADLQTGLVQLTTTQSEQNSWLLTDLNLCEIDIEQMLFADEGTEALCKSGEPLDLNSTYEEPVLELSTGTHTIVQWSLRDGLKIELKAGESGHVGTLTSATGKDKKLLGERVILSRPPQGDDLSRSLTLPFEGYSTFGTDVRLGTSALLSAGTISAYEDNPLWAERYLAGENHLSLGDTVRFIGSGSEDAVVKGFMRISLNDEGVEQGINVIAYSNVESAQGTRDSTRIKIFRFGSEGYQFSPTLWARMENAPDVILWVSALGLLLALKEVYATLLGLFARPEEAPMPKPDSEVEPESNPQTKSQKQSQDKSQKKSKKSKQSKGSKKEKEKEKEKSDD